MATTVAVSAIAASAAPDTGASCRLESVTVYNTAGGLPKRLPTLTALRRHDDGGVSCAWAARDTG